MYYKIVKRTSSILHIYKLVILFSCNKYELHEAPVRDNLLLGIYSVIHQFIINTEYTK